MSATLHTSLGDMKLEIFCDLVPRAAHNFLALAASSYYDGCKFHRSIPGFMVQTGDPTNTGKGGECIRGGLMEDEFSDHLKHDRRGILAFAGNGSNTIGSQFFILYEAAEHLDNTFTIFGRLMDGEGFTVLDKIEAQPVAGKKNRPVEDITLNSITIHANPLAK
jgi:peptidyl-prolyl cis-trans isomerase-like 3